MKAFIAILLATLVASCATSSYSYKEVNADGSTREAVAKMRPKDMDSLNLNYGNFGLSVNGANTADDPLAKMVQQMMPTMLCALSPAACPGAIAAGVAANDD
jgi:hypothetical protein